jgi:hypothetical protein
MNSYLILTQADREVQTLGQLATPNVPTADFMQRVRDTEYVHCGAQRRVHIECNHTAICENPQKQHLNNHVHGMYKHSQHTWLADHNQAVNRLNATLESAKILIDDFGVSSVPVVAGGQDSCPSRCNQSTCG